MNSEKLEEYKEQYYGLPDEIKTRCPWEAITERLFANHSEKLNLAIAMQGGGEFFGIDSEGKALFKDKGVEPVMYGFDEECELLRIYDRDPKQMKQVVEWAIYRAIVYQVYEDGYEPFPDDGDYGFSDEMKQALHTNKHFVASADGTTHRESVLKNARRALFNPDTGKVKIISTNVVYWGGDHGAMRLLRV